ncbi:HlyD family secretion protein [Legionella cardiaca]|uniref:HlyD family efflux transporter periplasmic adaptor subunit n=1 Tax=Legionella cardiaca TaxID=1071983 RepID=A0ABY8ARX0_9GAMM|nr:HlyD family efflux transporter periplasmic adaptor subunit [Legionella cardiaca]WED42956.1 HlyD family efflux transporter periplasmic adaptor subunit [Legionella cardiaca]
MKESDLFRKEALQQTKERIYGSVCINVPPQYTVSAIGFSIIIVSIILFLSFAEFSEKFIVSGYVNSTRAIVRVYPRTNGIISEGNIYQGMKVKKGKNLFLVDTSYVGASKNSDNDIVAQLQKRKKIIEKEVVYKSRNLHALAQLLEKKYVSLAEYNQKKEELLELKNKQSLIEMDMIRYNQSRSYRIRSPIDGIVSSILYKEGQYVNTTKSLITIIPDKAELIAELFIPARKAGFLRKDSKVVIRYDAYPYQRFGTYQASIKEISQNIMADDEEEKPFRIGEPYYKVIAKLDKQTVMVYGEIQKIQHGMTFSAVIVGSRRKLWQWILDPLYSYYGKLFS